MWSRLISDKRIYLETEFHPAEYSWIEENRNTREGGREQKRGGTEKEMETSSEQERRDTRGNVVSLTRPTPSPPPPPLRNSILFLALISPHPSPRRGISGTRTFPRILVVRFYRGQYNGAIFISVGSAPPLNNTSKLSLREWGGGGWNLAWRESVKPRLHFRAWLFRRKVFSRTVGGEEFSMRFWYHLLEHVKRVRVIRTKKFSDACSVEKRSMRERARDRWRGRCFFFCLMNEKTRTVSLFHHSEFGFYCYLGCVLGTITIKRSN